MTLVKMSFYGAVLIVLILILRPAVKRFMPKRTLLVMWWVALVRLTIPFDIPWKFSAYSAINNASPIIMAGGAAFDDVLSRNAFTGAISGAATGKTAASGTTAAETALTAPTSGFPILPAIYIAGLILTLAFFVFSYIRLMKSVRGAREVADEAVLEMVATCRRHVRVLSCESINSPFTFGLLRPVIVLPEALLLRECYEIRPVLLHELIHIRRFDAPMKLLVTLATCLHWFNPLCWIMAFVYARDVELACDAAVVREMGREYRAGYANMLLSIQSRDSISPLTGGFSRLAIKERIISIMKYRRIPVAASALAVALVLLMAAAFATSPAEIATAASDIASSWPYHAYNDQIGYDDFHPASFDVSENGEILMTGYTDTGKGKIGTLQICDADAYSEWDKMEISRDSFDLETYTLGDSEYIDAKFADDDTIAVLRGIRRGDDYHYSIVLVKDDLDIMKADCLSKTEYGVYPVTDGLLINGKPDAQTVRISKMDMSGNVLWQILLAEPIMFNGIITSGGVHMAYGQNGDDCVILAFDNQGNILWRYDDAIMTELTDAVLSDSGNIVLVGYDLSRTGNGAASVITSFDTAGNQLFMNGYTYLNDDGGSSPDAVFRSVAKVGEGFIAGFIIPDEFKIGLVIYDGQGAIVSERAISTSGLILKDNTKVRADDIKLINVANEAFAIFHGYADYDSWLGTPAYVTILTQIIQPKG